MKLKNLLSLMALGAVTLASAQGAYDYSRLQREPLGRGVVAVRENPSTVMVSWRYLSSDPENQAFDVYRNGKKVNSKPITEGSFFKDKNTSDSQAVYTVKPAKGDRAGEFTLPAKAPCGYINIDLDRPDLGVDPNGREYFYNANDASIGDVDGDGEYEIILKWIPPIHMTTHMTDGPGLPCLTATNSTALASGASTWATTFARVLTIHSSWYMTSTATDALKS